MSTPANTKAHILREKLKALVDRGIAGEQASAARKLKRLEAKYDFGAANPDGGDLFADALKKFGDPTGCYWQHRGNERPLAEVFADSEIASFVKYALLNAYRIEGKIRENQDRTFTVIVEAAKESMKTLNFVARTLHNAFRALLAAFLTLPGASQRDARLFIRAVYDGCLNDEKQPGERLPERAPVKMPKGRKRALVVAPALAIHPYSVGLEMGRKVRLSIPLDQIAGDLKEADRIARLN